jgi:hypothetical protein
MTARLIKIYKSTVKQAPFKENKIYSAGLKR